MVSRDKPIGGSDMMKKIVMGLLTLFLLSIPIGCAKETTPTSAPPPAPETTPLPPAWHLMHHSVFLLKDGEEQFIAGVNSPMAEFLLDTTRKLNVEVECVLTQEDIREIEDSSRAVKLRFRFTEDVAVSQLVRQEEIDKIKTTENGLRILEDVKYVVFILEDNLGKGLEGHILVGQGVPQTWSCWIIWEESGNAVDKGWVDKVEEFIEEL